MVIVHGAYRVKRGGMPSKASLHDVMYTIFCLGRRIEEKGEGILCPTSLNPHYTARSLHCLSLQQYASHWVITESFPFPCLKASKFQVTLITNRIKPPVTASLAVYSPRPARPQPQQAVPQGGRFVRPALFTLRARQPAPLLQRPNPPPVIRLQPDHPLLPRARHHCRIDGLGGGQYQPTGHSLPF